MREYLDRRYLQSALYDKYCEMCNTKSKRANDFLDGFKYAVKLIDMFRIEKDIAPVVHAKWEYDEEELQKHIEPLYRCTNCGFRAWGDYEMTDFCGGCGAKMDLEEDK